MNEAETWRPLLSVQVRTSAKAEPAKRAVTTRLLNSFVVCFIVVWNELRGTSWVQTQEEEAQLDKFA